MTQQRYAEHWLPNAQARAEGGELDAMVASELFDHTWMASVHQLRNHLNLGPGARVLDAGCGWGRLLVGVKYFERGLQADGYELTPEFVSKAQELLSLHGLAEDVNVRQGDLLEVDLPADHYDSVYSSRVVHYIEEKDVLVRKFYSTLKPGGRAMIIIPNRDSPYQRRVYRHAPLFPIRSVGAIMESAGFRQISYGGYRFLPSSWDFSHESLAAKLEVGLAKTPLGRLGGLAYAVGEK